MGNTVYVIKTNKQTNKILSGKILMLISVIIPTFFSPIHKVDSKIQLLPPVHAQKSDVWLTNGK